MQRRQFLSTAAAAQTPPVRPNVLTILCDQLNAAVMSVYGGPVSTPNLERLARQGLLFHNATCPTPFCSPSRASIVTGQYPHQHGVVYNVSKIDYPDGHPARATEEGITQRDITADRLLHAAGYSTHQYGKWHLSGDRLPYYPDPYGEHHEYRREMASVFAEVERRPAAERMNWYGWLLPVKTNAAYVDSFRGDEPFLQHYTGDFIRRMGRLEFPERDVFDFRVTERALARMRTSQEKPFHITCSLNWPHDPNVVHSPWYEESDPKKVAFPKNFATREERFERDISRQMVANATEVRMREFLRIYYATVRFVDHQVGRLLDELERLKLAANTIVIFSADHGDMAGGHGMAWKSTSAFYDEVTRIPLIFRWPGHIRPGTTEAAASLVDLAPTILGLTGVGAHAGMQGRSLAPVVLGRAAATQYVYGLCERVRGNRDSTRQVAPDTPASFMWRGGGWKYVVYPGGGDYLYDLRKDPGETRNLAAERGAQATKEHMRDGLKKFLKQTEYPGNPLA